MTASLADIERVEQQRLRRARRRQRPDRRRGRSGHSGQAKPIVFAEPVRLVPEAGEPESSAADLVEQAVGRAACGRGRTVLADALARAMTSTKGGRP